ncbi:hypothetical protein MTP99_017266 [Tenebrio molitor]|nr:hypothetical protein MTP99_017266 [Tenebrio molitor]
MVFFKGSKYSYFVILAADVIAFITGTSIAWSSPVLAILRGDDLNKIPLGRKITTDEESWIGSVIEGHYPCHYAEVGTQWDGGSVSRFWKKAGVFRGTERGTPELSPKSVPVHEE